MSRALSKQAMAEGIAEMMKQMAQDEKKRQDQHAGECPENDVDEDEAGPKAQDGGLSRRDDKATSRQNGNLVPEAEGPEDIARRYEIPMTHEANLRGHYKSVTCIGMDPSGSRVAVGGMDYKMLLYDFGGMDRTHKPFREVESEEGVPVIAVSWSTTGDRILCATASAQAKIFDRDGMPLLVFVKGDPYIADMAQTKGHTLPVTAAQWHPMERETVMTASLDGTIRLWDLNGPRTFDKLMCKRVIKARSRRNTAIPITCASYSPSADYAAAGAQDGSIQLFSLKKISWIKPDIVMRPGHETDTHVTAVAFAPDGRTLASRGMDNTVRLWDSRKPQAPLKVFSHLDTFHDSANVAFSPDGRILCCGTNIPRGEGTGTIKFYEVQAPSTEPLLQIGVAPESSITNLTWHRRLKQIICGTSSGISRVLYDPVFSIKGALMSSTRTRRAKDASDCVPDSIMGRIVNPNALPMYREDNMGRKRRREKDRADPVKSKKPEIPMTGPGAQGRVSGTPNFTQYVLAHTKKQNESIMSDDPREAILKYAEQAKAGTQLVNRAYARTAPVTPLTTKTFEEEVEEMEKMEQEILRK